MIVSESVKPPVGGMGGSIHDWERSEDPWHPDAAPEEFKSAFSQINGEKPRAWGWMALDWCGNCIAFIRDGTELKD